MLWAESHHDTVLAGLGTQPCLPSFHLLREKPNEILGLLFQVRVEEGEQPNYGEMGNVLKVKLSQAQSPAQGSLLWLSPLCHLVFFYFEATMYSSFSLVSPQVMTELKSAFCKVWFSSLRLTKAQHQSRRAGR